MRDIIIPKKEKREKRLFVPVTQTEHKKVMDYCKKKEVNLTDLIRYALNQTYELL